MQKLIFDHAAVGLRIRRRRLELGLTQEQLAEEINKASRYCADIERGKCGMSIETLLDFCSVLRISPTILLLGEVSFYPDRDTLEQIHSGLLECTEEEQRHILEGIRLLAQYK